jgi:hypothetical protein
MLNDSAYVTLEDVAATRQALLAAHRQLNARRTTEWLLGGSILSVVFYATTWFLSPSASVGIYVIIAIGSYVVGGIAVLMNMEQQAKWRKAKEVELDGIESQIHSGAMVQRPNPKP